MADQEGPQSTLDSRLGRFLTFDPLEERRLLSVANPFIAVPITVNVTQGTPGTVISLPGTMRGRRRVGCLLNYSVTADTNSALFSTSPVGVPPGNVLARFASNTLGTAELTVQAIGPSVRRSIAR